MTLSILVGACATMEPPGGGSIGHATLRTAAGTPIGRAEFLAAGEQISLAIVATGLDPGIHGFHLHSVGRCSAPDFASAGGHLNPAGKRHGTGADGGPHLGDLPNLVVAPNRSVSTTIDLPGSRAEWVAQLFDTDGTALIIHADADDYRTDPSGNSGPRIACGTLERNS